MLRNHGAFRGSAILARDGAIGSIVDLYFDDRLWSVRYFVLDTGNPMPRREVLVSPSQVRGDDAPPVRVRLSRAQVEKCPEASEDKPVYLQHDIASLAYRGDPHLRSCEAIAGYAVQALDRPSGHVHGFLVDTGSWAIDSLIVDTGNWLPGKRVLVPPADVERIDWLERKVRLRISRDAVRQKLAYPAHLSRPLSGGVRP